MAKKKWGQLTHPERIRILKEAGNEEIITEFEPPAEIAKNDFERYLESSRELWQPNRLGEAISVGVPPNKETLLGAWRDLNKSEALLELIDNSIDAWLRRRAKYPNYTTKTLQIYIDLETEILTYEDNAGGVNREHHNNLVNPGNSETSPFDRTIGSYRTGGKKAVFKLAEEVAIQTRYRDPDGIEDTAYSVQLDKAWLEDPIKYEFLIYPMTKPDIESGHTKYTFRLRNKDWSLDEIEHITKEIQIAYSLLIVRSPNIEIYFNTREISVQPLKDLYKFSGAINEKVDIRPQRIKFKSTLEHKGKEKEVEIEVVLGCRTTTGLTENDIFGIDLYGNDRLFISHNQDELLRWYNLPTGNASKLVRGYINIMGPNIFVPWDTHKRHLNTDHQIVGLLKSKPIKDFFFMWRKAYLAISGSPAIKDTIKQQYEIWYDVKKHDIRVEHDNSFEFALTKKHKAALPKGIHEPRVAITAAAKVKPITISISITKEEFRRLRSIYGIDSTLNEKQAKLELAEAIRSNII